MRVKAPRPLLIFEAVLLLCAILLVGYKWATRVRPLPIDQAKTWKKKSPEAQIQDYYRQYAESYIRISKETWRLDPASRTAVHSFILKNTAQVSYSDIEIRFTYESSSGKTLQSQTVKIPGTLSPGATREMKTLSVRNVPAASAGVLMNVAKASVYK
jgi:hypothetical protein